MKLKFKTFLKPQNSYLKVTAFHLRTCFMCTACTTFFPFLLVILKDFFFFSMVGLPIVVVPACRLTQSTGCPWRREDAINYSGLFCLMLP